MEHTGTRLKQIRKHLELTQAELAEKLGCGKANISMIETGKASLTERNKRILVQLLNINPEFIDDGSLPIGLPFAGGVCSVPHTGSVPLYDLKNVRRLGQLLGVGGGVTPEAYICIPDIPHCDGAVYYIGDTMYPILRSGDMVMYSRLAGTSEIFWGDMYLVGIETGVGERIIVCYLDRSDKPGKAVMRGADPARSSTEIDISKIRSIAFVKATIRFNTAK